MLAYVFWHWRQSSVSPTEYERLQREFHHALAGEPPSGFSRSFSVTLAGAPWANAGAESYEDWYLVRDFPDLGPLNDAAVTASRRRPHDAAAAVAAGGAAGLYRVRLGEPQGVPRYATWFAKPAGMSYERLWQVVTPIVQRSRGAIWMRQMVLGPTTEFCLHTEAPVELPAAIAARTLELRTVWPT
ncbi:MAG TPA: hypothetical protein VJ803_00940 [Gemmatimonadaceae bacterium]|nr:hypothetical protein [Gemmatimonadaceae bacterium]